MDVEEKHFTCAKEGVSFTSTPDAELGRTTLLKFLCSREETLREQRLLPLAFYMEYRFFQTTGHRLTAIDWVKHPCGGMYSPDLSSAISNSSEVKVRRDWLHDDRIVEIDDVRCAEVSETVEHIYEETNGVSTNNLCVFTESVPLYRDAPVDGRIDFSKLRPVYVNSGGEEMSGSSNDDE